MLASACGALPGEVVDGSLCVGEAIAAVINILDPDVVMLGGGISNRRELYADVPARWGRYVFSDTVATRLEPPVYGDSSGVRGAAWLWPPE